MEDYKSQLREVLPKTGLVYSERGALAEVRKKELMIYTNHTINKITINW
jgi:hypothetical protein